MTAEIIPIHDPNSIFVVDDPVLATDTDGEGPDFDGLVYLAQCIAEATLSKVNWDAMLPAALAVVSDPEDAKVIIRLIKAGKFSVHIGPPE